MKPFIAVFLSLGVILLVETTFIILWLYWKDRNSRRNRNRRLDSIIQLYAISGAMLVFGLAAFGFTIVIPRSRTSHDLKPWVFVSQLCILASSTSFDNTLTRTVLALEWLDHSRGNGLLRRLRTYCIWPVVKCITAVILNVIFLRKSIQNDIIWSGTCLYDTACKIYKEDGGRDVVWLVTCVFVGISCLEYLYQGGRCVWLLRHIGHRWKKNYIIIYGCEARCGLLEMGTLAGCRVLLPFTSITALLAGFVSFRQFRRLWNARIHASTICCKSIETAPDIASIRRFRQYALDLHIGARTQNRKILNARMEPLPSPKAPWKEIALDFISRVPPSLRDGVAYESLLVVVDRFSKMALYFPVKKTITAVQTMDLLIDGVFTRCLRFLIVLHCFTLLQPDIWNLPRLAPILSSAFVRACEVVIIRFQTPRWVCLGENDGGIGKEFDFPDATRKSAPYNKPAKLRWKKSKQRHTNAQQQKGLANVFYLRNRAS
ncbi:putative gag polymerase env protein [Venturia nashicola]|uniref:Putative gag polymerase env protein n=1 Tax=Venturia nashicola TaxID=86259 RepID=A0A4Z1NSM8_9PEZI|nr:putative gag polymerase env protein [Venturia nashicola]